MILTVSARPSDQEWLNRLNRRRICMVFLPDAKKFDARLDAIKRYRCGRKSLLESKVAAHAGQMALRSKLYKKHQRKGTNGSSKANSRSRRH